MKRIGQGVYSDAQREGMHPPRFEKKKRGKVREKMEKFQKIRLLSGGTKFGLPWRLASPDLGSVSKYADK